MAKAKLAAFKPLKARSVTCAGGPWHGVDIITRIPSGHKTLVITVGSDPRVYNKGRYKMGAWEAEWEPVNV